MKVIRGKWSTISTWRDWNEQKAEKELKKQYENIITAKRMGDKLDFLKNKK